MHDSSSSVAEPLLDDVPTVCAIAVIAVSLVTSAHAALGHGAACAAAGGHITQLTTVYFQCSVQSIFVAPAGPAGNYFAALLAFAAQRTLPSKASRARLLALLVMAFSLFWEAAYLLSSMITGHGDYFTGAQDLLGGPHWAWRTESILAGLILYILFIRIMGRCVAGFTITPGRVSPLLGFAWVAALIAAGAAALLYAPARGDSFTGASCAILASFPLLYPFNRVRATEANSAPPITRSNVWIGAAILVYAVFAATLGRGFY